MVGLRQVAKEANVSVTSASRVLNGSKRSRYISREMERRVREAARKLGYVGGYHRYALRTGKTDVIGLLVSVADSERELEGLVRLRSTDHYHNCVIGGIEHVAYEFGYSLLLVAPETKDGTRFSHVVEKPIEGLLCPNVTSERMRERMVALVQQKEDLPIVLINPMYETPVTTVKTDQAAAAKLVLDHLGEHGHKDLLWFGPDDRVDGNRYQAYARAIEDRDMRLSRVETKSRSGLRHHNENEPVAALREKVFGDAVADGFHQTAVIGWNDFYAGSASRILLQKGLRIPEDVSIVGHDNAFSSFTYPKLTSVDFQWDRVARRATELLFEMIHGGADRIRALRDTCEWFEPMLAIRESTGPAPSTPPAIDRLRSQQDLTKP